jgi:cytochrome c peroxidase
MLGTPEGPGQASVASRARICALVALAAATALVAIGCGEHAFPPAPPTGPPSVGVTLRPQAATVSAPFNYDATLGGTAFIDAKARGLTYAVTFSPSANGLTASGGRVSGIPLAPGVISVRVTATDVGGEVATQSFPVVAFAAGLLSPSLQATPYQYSEAANPLPAHFRVDPGAIGPAIDRDNTPATNPVSDAGAALGRVLFYDPRLSVNDRVACASCHQQAFGFGDTARFSRGVAGHTARRTMGLANARFYQLGRFFWDERASTLEDQILRPVQDQVEMGMTLDNLILKLSLTTYYPPLFQAAFGSPDITPDRISLAVAQFVRSMVSARSRFDLAFNASGTLDPTKLTAEERTGQQLFAGAAAGCAACHATNAVVTDAPHNTGLDLTITDPGAGGGRFKAPSLRNIAIRPPYMHDGRFQTLEEVVEFYDSGVQPSPGLDSRLRTGQGPKRLNLTATQRAAIVAYLRTLTDSSFIADPKFSSPFGAQP